MEQTIKFNEEFFSIFKGEPYENTGDWLRKLSDEDLDDWVKMTSRLPDERSKVEEDVISHYTWALYAIELDIEEIALDIDFLVQLTGRFCLTIMWEKFRRQGIILIKDVVTLANFDDIRIQVTPKGAEAAQNILLDDSKV